MEHAVADKLEPLIDHREDPMLGPRLFRIFDEIVNDPLLLGGQPAPDRTPPTSEGADVHDVALQRVVEVGLREDGNFTDDTNRDWVRGLLVRQVLRRSDWMRGRSTSSQGAWDLGVGTYVETT